MESGQEENCFDIPVDSYQAQDRKVHSAGVPVVAKAAIGSNLTKPVVAKGFLRRLVGKKGSNSSNNRGSAGGVGGPSLKNSSRLTLGIAGSGNIDFDVVDSLSGGYDILLVPGSVVVSDQPRRRQQAQLHYLHHREALGGTSSTSQSHDGRRSRGHGSRSTTSYAQSHSYSERHEPAAYGYYAAPPSPPKTQPEPRHEYQFTSCPETPLMPSDASQYSAYPHSDYSSAPSCHQNTFSFQHNNSYDQGPGPTGGRASSYYVDPHSAAGSTSPVVNDKSSSFWKWDIDAQKWRHDDSQTGETIFCPDELD